MFKSGKRKLKPFNQEFEEEMRIVLLGKTGCGKSSAGNTILEEQRFKTDSSPNPVTLKCEAKTKSGAKTKCGAKTKNKAKTIDRITVVDTPGLFDIDASAKDLNPEIVRCIVECAPGPHAFLIVLKVESYTDQVITNIEKHFSLEAFKYATVLFTHGDQLEGKTIQDFVKTNEKLSGLVEKCGGRCHVIDNKYWNDKRNQKQVAALRETIKEMVKNNGGEHYTNNTFAHVQDEIEKEKIHVTENNNSGMSEDEIEKKAKDSVRSCTGLNKLVGKTVGMVLGALLGIKGSYEHLTSIDNKLKRLSKTFSVEALGDIGVKLGMCLAFSIVVVQEGIQGAKLGADAAKDAETMREAVYKAAKEVLGHDSTILDSGIRVVDNVTALSELYSKMCNK